MGWRFDRICIAYCFYLYLFKHLFIAMSCFFICFSDVVVSFFERIDSKEVDRNRTQLLLILSCRPFLDMYEYHPTKVDEQPRYDIPIMSTPNQYSLSS